MRRALLTALVLCLCLWPAAGLSTTEAELLSLLSRAERRYAGLEGYSALMVTREWVKDALEPEKTILLKFQRPFKVYMKWIEGHGKGREGLYASDAHDGKFLIYEPNGFRRLFTAAMDPRDPRIMEVSRHPVTDIGIGRLLEIVGENVRRAARQGVLRLIDRGQTVVGGRRTREIEGILPKDSSLGYYSYRVILSFDLEHHLPIRVVAYDWQDRLVEDYAYTQLQLDPEFRPEDFDPANPSYSFSGFRIRFGG